VVADADITAPHVYATVLAVPAELSAIRSEFTGWAWAIGLQLEQTIDILLAADEAVTNSIKHAYPDIPGTVTVVAVIDRHRPKVHVIVSDTGTWCPPPAFPGPPRYGLSIVDSLAPLFDLYHDASGTTVLLGWPLT
jgi:anti-sigma regulatory factor (Ser/Thr protein kinase)